MSPVATARSGPPLGSSATQPVSVQWVRHPTVARSQVRNPQMTHFYGAAPMALMTVGLGALLLGKDLVGTRLAVDLDWVLWTAGTIGGLFTAMTIPFLMFTQLEVGPDAAFGGWLMPVVPPMVSAASGALLLPHLPPGTARTGTSSPCTHSTWSRWACPRAPLPPIWGSTCSDMPSPVR